MDSPDSLSGIRALVSLVPVEEPDISIQVLDEAPKDGRRQEAAGPLEKDGPGHAETVHDRPRSEAAQGGESGKGHDVEAHDPPPHVVGDEGLEHRVTARRRVDQPSADQCGHRQQNPAASRQGR